MTFGPRGFLGVSIALVATVVAGCAGSLALASLHATKTAVGTPGNRLALRVAAAPVGGDATTARGGTGAIQVTVLWPTTSGLLRTAALAPRGVQTIPLSAATIALSLASGSTMVATASIASPLTTSTLTRIPVGSYTLLAEALRSDGSDAASASAPLSVVANRVASAALDLVPTAGPTLSGISPSSGPPGSQIDLNGSNLLPPSGSTYSVLVDGQAVPGSQLQAGSSTIYLIGMPSWATTSGTATISVSVDGVTAPETEIYTVENVECVTMSPLASTLITSATQQFTATAYGDLGCSQTLSGIAFSWQLTNMNPPPSTSTGATPSFTLSSGLFQTYVSTGSAWVGVSAGGQSATTSIVASVSAAILDATPAPGGVI